MSMQQQLLSLAQRTIKVGLFIRRDLVPAKIWQNLRHMHVLVKRMQHQIYSYFAITCDIIATHYQSVHLIHLCQLPSVSSSYQPCTVRTQLHTCTAAPKRCALCRAG
jgi:hypothetical protein